MLRLQAYTTAAIFAYREGSYIDGMVADFALQRTVGGYKTRDSGDFANGCSHVSADVYRDFLGTVGAYSLNIFITLLRCRIRDLPTTFRAGAINALGHAHLDRLPGQNSKYTIRAAMSMEFFMAVGALRKRAVALIYADVESDGSCAIWTRCRRGNFRALWPSFLCSIR